MKLLIGLLIKEINYIFIKLLFERIFGINFIFVDLLYV